MLLDAIRCISSRFSIFDFSLQLRQADRGAAEPTEINQPLCNAALQDVATLPTATEPRR
jgi:hypothetical protein